jgi:hypothetical protein
MIHRIPSRQGRAATQISQLNCLHALDIRAFYLEDVSEMPSMLTSRAYEMLRQGFFLLSYTCRTVALLQEAMVKVSTRGLILYL